MPPPTLRGASLIELLITLLLVETAAVGLTAAVLTASRAGRRLDEGRQVDLARREAVARAMADSGCRAAAAPAAIELLLPATPSRPPILVTLRCGP
jgi:Tfp pilus assembly protein PilV